MRRVIAIVALVSCGALMVSAQTLDFSGSWALDQAMTTAAALERRQAAGSGGGGGGRGGVAGGIANGGGISSGGAAAMGAGGFGGGRGGGGGVASDAVNPDIEITMTPAAMTVQMAGRELRYGLDGGETMVNGARTRASWQDARLVITSERDVADRTLTTSTAWYFEGDVLVREVGGAKSFYRRK